MNTFLGVMITIAITVAIGRCLDNANAVDYRVDVVIGGLECE